MNEQPEEVEQDTPQDVEADTSHAMDLVSVFEAMGADAEMEAMAVKGVLDAAGIDVVMVGSSSLPNLTFSVQVPVEMQEEALRRIEEAKAAGPAAAEEAERAGETPEIPASEANA